MRARGVRALLRVTAMGLGLGLTLVAPVRAALFDDNEARARIEQLRQRLEGAQGTLDTVSRNQLEFSNQVEALRAEMAKINGALEVLKYELENTQKRQQDFYVDLDNRLRKLEPQPVTAPTDGAAPAPAAGATGATGATSKPEPAVADTTAYEKAVTALKAGKAREAAAAFDSFIATYPQSKLLGSAYFWNGYAHSQMKDHRGAAALFGKFADAWADDPRAPDALESRAESLAALKDVKGAQAVLHLLADKYPTSDAGKRARQQLKKK